MNSMSVCPPALFRQLLAGGFRVHECADGCLFFSGRLPDHLVWSAADFQKIWQLRPGSKHVIRVHGKFIETPRFQQAFGADYRYTGNVNRALPILAELRPILQWSKATVADDLNGLLLNWYDGPEQYIGEHHDSISGLRPGSPIITISFGETRVFRLSRGTGPERTTYDFNASEGTVFVMPFRTNHLWKHSVPKSTRYQGRRISVTFRAFTTGVLPTDKYFAGGSVEAVETQFPSPNNLQSVSLL